MHAAVADASHLAAIHEAGHVAALWRLGALDALARVELLDDSGAAALVCRAELLPEPEQLARLPRPCAVALARRSAVFLLAGPCAELRRQAPSAGEAWLERDPWFLSGQWRDDADEDYHRAEAAAAVIGGPGEPALALVRQAAAQAWRLLEDSRASQAVEAIAEALLTRRRLDAGDVHRILDRRIG